MSKKTVQTPTANWRPINCQMSRIPSAHATGMYASSTARTESPAIRIGRRRRRSTQTPAGSAKRMKGRNPSIPSTENANGDACRPTAASQGIARPETWEPNSLTDWPVQSLRKSALRHSPPVGRRSLRIGGSSVLRDGEAVRLAFGVVGGAEVVGELFESAREPARVTRRKPCPEEGEGRPVVVVEGKHLLGGATEGCRCNVPDAFAVLLGALEEEEARGAAVVALRQRAHLPRPDYPDEARLLEHLQVVADRPLRQLELLGELGRRGGALAQQDDDLRAEIVAECAQLLVLPHDEHVNRLVVRRGKADALVRGGRRTGHVSGMYDFSRLLANAQAQRRGQARLRLLHSSVTLFTNARRRARASSGGPSKQPRILLGFTNECGSVSPIVAA